MIFKHPEQHSKNIMQTKMRRFNKKEKNIEHLGTRITIDSRSTQSTKNPELPEAPPITIAILPNFDKLQSGSLCVMRDFFVKPLILHSLPNGRNV